MDLRILEDALATLAARHDERLSALELKLKADENKVKGGFDRERVGDGGGGLVSGCLR